jgi:hypothetical protein
MTAELRKKLKKLWKDKIRYDRLYGLTGNEEFLKMKKRIVDEVFNIVPLLLIMKSYNPMTHSSTPISSLTSSSECLPSCHLSGRISSPESNGSNIAVSEKIGIRKETTTEASNASLSSTF